MSILRRHAHAIIINGKVARNSILSIDTASPLTPPIVTAFSSETEATTSFNGVLIVAPTGYMIPHSHTAMLTPDNFTSAISQLAAEVPSIDGKNYEIIALPL